MHQIKHLSAFFILVLLSACIKTYDPKIDSNSGNKYVVSGRVTDTEGWQKVEVSMSSPVISPKFIPVSRCRVMISDNKSNSFILDEYEPGKYRVWMDQASLTPGTAYKVMVITLDNEMLTSGYDTMPNGPKLDSIYYHLKAVPTPDPANTDTVMQFYTDLDAIGNYSRFYKWEVEETWEYHAAHPLEYYYDGETHKVIPPDYSKNVCYATVPVKNVFTVSTKNLSQNAFYQYPLHVVDGHTSRLKILYSFLIRQLAISEGAYNYWEQMRINSNQDGGLYEKQPFAIKGNLKNVTSPDRDVLGYFYAAPEQTRRYFYKDVEGVKLDFPVFCNEDPPGRMGWREFSPSQYPIYFYYNASGFFRILSDDCIDCRRVGGVLEKPDFWP